jgi:hypothetical protein
MARTEFQRKIDDKLTEKINNIPQVRTFLVREIQNFSKVLNEEHIKFFIKGGSGLQILMGEADSIKSVEGWSDFDTQLIINPNLSAEKWYEFFIKVNTAIKLIFLPQLQKNWDIFCEENQKKICSPIYNPKISFADKNIINLELEEKQQNNTIMSLSSEYLHPMQYLDNARSVISNNKSTGITPKELDAYYPLVTEKIEYCIKVESYVTMDKYIAEHLANSQGIRSNENKIIPKASSIFINYTISKFVLYRLVVRYRSNKYTADGTEFTTKDKYEDQAKFRGELFDLSIPRRETEEAIHQWKNVKPINEKYNNFTVPIPNWDYHAAENMLLIFEVLEETSNSAHKFYKRVKRGGRAFIEIGKHNNEWNKKLGYSIGGFHDGLVKAYHSKDKHRGDYKVLYKYLAQSLKQDYLIHERLFKNSKYSNEHDSKYWISSIEKQYDLIKNNIIFNAEGISIHGVLQKQYPGLGNQAKYNESAYIMGFMKLFKTIHDGFSFKLSTGQLNKLNNICNTITNISNSHEEGDSMKIEIKVEIENCSLCGIFSSYVDYYYTLKETMNNFSYNVPYFELYAFSEISTDDQIRVIIKELKKFYTKEKIEYMKSDELYTYINEELEDKPAHYIVIIKEEGAHPILIHFVTKKHKALHEIFHKTSTHEESGYNILKKKEIIKFINYKITKSFNFYMIHWLDGIRTKYMEAITTF